jgi:hypothetical protein
MRGHVDHIVKVHGLPEAIVWEGKVYILKTRDPNDKNKPSIEPSYYEAISEHVT